MKILLFICLLFITGCATQQTIACNPGIPCEKNISKEGPGFFKVLLTEFITQGFSAYQTGGKSVETPLIDRWIK